ncbi:hypothetical protein [Enterocloster sp.]|uniref:phage tail assembly chaperone n=1 Tax=Enterocloster sp. TaxID=2719315 RepID=UPI003076D1C3
MANLAKTAGKMENTQEVREEEFSEKETQGQLLTVESDFIAGMLAAAAYKNDELRQIDIVRDGKLYFSFRVHALGEEEANKCRKKYTKYVRNKQIGIKFAEETDNAKFRSSLIYHATVEEDRTKLWDNQQVWEGLRKQGVLVVTALDVIESVLLGGEKDKVIDEINKLSGFDSENLEEVENKMEETAKN